MKYIYGEGVEKPKSYKWLFVPFGIFLAVAYVFANMQAPIILASLQSPDETAKKLASNRPDEDEGRLYIPKINLDTPLMGADSDEIEALANGAVQRSPQSGNPSEGGNFVVTAHRFSLALVPTETKQRSTFYHLDKLSNGDDVYVDYNGTRYAYSVEKRSTLSATDASIEQRSDEPRLTLYAVEESENGKREVVTAKMIGEVVWTNGQPKIKAKSAD